MALISTDREEEAVHAYQQALENVSKSGQYFDNQFSLEKNLADLYLATGQFKMAQKQYEKIINKHRSMVQVERWASLQLALINNAKGDSKELKDYSRLIKENISIISSLEGQGLVWQEGQFLRKSRKSAISENVAELAEAIESRAEHWFSQMMVKVDLLIEESKYQTALKSLESLPKGLLSPEKKELIARKKEFVINKRLCYSQQL